MKTLRRATLTALSFGLICNSVFAQPPVVETIPLPLPNVTMSAPAAVPTVDMFAKSFCPVAGKYEVTLLHPKTCCPVTVCFCLPNCKEVCKVKATKNVLRFEYKGRDVVIRFKHDGTVSVRDA